jgi:hypothetical protein
MLPGHSSLRGKRGLGMICGLLSNYPGRRHRSAPAQCQWKESLFSCRYRKESVMRIGAQQRATTTALALLGVCAPRHFVAWTHVNAGRIAGPAVSYKPFIG